MDEVLFAVRYWHLGEVVSGMDVLKLLEASGSQSGQTSERLTMTKVTVEVK